MGLLALRVDKVHSGVLHPRLNVVALERLVIHGVLWQVVDAWPHLIHEDVESLLGLGPVFIAMFFCLRIKKVCIT